MTRQRGARRVERSAIWAFVPVFAMAPFALLALAVFWLPIWALTGVPYGIIVAGFAVVGLLLFVRPFQVSVLTPLLGARRPTSDEAARIEPAWAAIAQANHLEASQFVVRVLPSDEVNTFACGGHLVVLTSFAADELTPGELSGVLAHELSHHLGLHTLAITIGHWMSAPVVVLARIGFYLENVARAAAGSFGRRSALIETVSSVTAAIIGGLSWLFTAALRAGDALANYVGHEAEYEADQRAVDMGYGPELASALQRVLDAGHGERAIGWRARLAASHPSARTRIARIGALQRARGPAR